MLRRCLQPCSCRLVGITRIFGTVFPASVNLDIRGDGYLFIMGRVDKATMVLGRASLESSQQPKVRLQVVKVRGFRVDLDGLEAILAKCPYVTAPSLNDLRHGLPHSTLRACSLVLFDKGLHVCSCWGMFCRPAKRRPGIRLISVRLKRVGF